MLLLRFGLWLLSLVYAFCVMIRNLMFRIGMKSEISVTIPVISVGNITTGGTGKTPMVAWIAKQLRESGYRVTLLSRGYGSVDGGFNDEAMELYRRLPDVPHLQNPDRVASALTAIEELDAQVLVLDDGFQHRRLARDLNVVLIDATCPFGHGFLLPRGLLREPVGSLRRADVVIITRTSNVSEARLQVINQRLVSICGSTPILKVSHVPMRLVNCNGDERSIDFLHDRDVCAFSAIGNPRAFEESLESLSANLIGAKRFQDHHIFTEDDIRSLESLISNSTAEVLVCTCKDLVKIGVERIGEYEVWAVEIDVSIDDGEDTLNSLITQTVKRFETGQETE